ncbi:MAG: Ig domain-containing protein [Verrucomicrobia bacterium]|jgi:hypothetical protein|nr:Ig domain-containing protein [Verrucomicrobiota bacterium]
MLRLLKQCWWLVVLATGTTTAPAFSLLGPVNEPYQVPVIGYDLPGDIGAPKNLGEEYRWNKPTLYYAFDQNFLDFFGSNGVLAVEQAIGIYNGLTNVSQYSSDLSEFPMESRRFNFRAQAMTLLDLKSVMMNLLAEQLGLAEPDRYTWCLHDRFVGPGGCPADVSYLVIKRNFDPVTSTLDQLQPSSYVNGVLYSYQIIEFCNPPNPLADAFEFSVDPLANTFTAVAANGIDYGSFYTGLTRDDVAGLRYLLRTNNMNVESAGNGTLTAATNLNASQLLVTSNLTSLVAAAPTNDAAALTALFPGLIIASTTSYFTLVVTTNTFAYYTNLPWAPAGSPATLTNGTIRTTNVATRYNHTFANVVTNSYYTNGMEKLQTTTVGAGACGPIAPPGLICTNVTWQTVATNGIVGDYYLLPTNSACGVLIIRSWLTNVYTVTNDLVTATNAAGVTNLNNQQFSQSTISYFTNHIFEIHPVPCVSNAVALRQGIEKVRFVRRDFDSLIGQFFDPITDEYTVGVITNSTLYRQSVRRLVTRPDLLISAADLTAGPAGLPAVPSTTRTISFNSANALPGLAGPGTIEPDVQFTFNKVGPVYLNFSPSFMDELSQETVLIWGSFDGTTNAPVVYPNGTSVENLENQVLIQVSPTGPVTNGVVTLPNGTVGSDYAGVFSGFTVLGGQAPYAWGLAPGSPALPPNLILNPNVGTISGAPTNSTAGLTFDFVLRMTDAGARFVDRPYAIKINP